MISLSVPLLSKPTRNGFGLPEKTLGITDWDGVIRKRFPLHPIQFDGLFLVQYVQPIRIAAVGEIHKDGPITSRRPMLHRRGPVVSRHLECLNGMASLRPTEVAAITSIRKCPQRNRGLTLTLITKPNG